MRAEILRRVREEFVGLEVKVQWSEMDADMRKETMKRARKSAQTRAPGTKISESTYVVAIASGKGGVGKSTLTVNLAVALAKLGHKVGLLDADIYGPSQPRMMGVSKRPASPDGKVIIPLQAHGVTMMSIGLMVDPNKAVVWRGPMLMGALQQMLNQVQWGDLDVLIIDLPPGTGAVQLSLAQMVPLAGAITVTTPQGSTTISQAFEVIDITPTIVSVNPPAAPSSGGTTITIAGNYVGGW